MLQRVQVRQMLRGEDGGAGLSLLLQAGGVGEALLPGGPSQAVLLLLPLLLQGLGVADTALLQRRRLLQVVRRRLLESHCVSHALL